jgi:DNA-binding NarL/FixJ family response regulator
MNKTVLVIDDHPLFRKALINLVEEIVGEGNVYSAASAEEGVRKLQETRVDLVMLDLGLPGIAGVDATALVRGACNAMILVVSASENRQEVSGATRAGAAAVVSKGVSMQALRDVVSQALSGTVVPGQWIRPANSRTLLEGTGRGLTIRQHEIVTLLLNGLSNKEIGLRLGLAEITVKTHLTAIFRLLGVVNRTQAVVAVRRLGVDRPKADSDSPSTAEPATTGTPRA